LKLTAATPCLTVAAKVSLATGVVIIASLVLPAEGWSTDGLSDVLDVVPPAVGASRL